MPKISKDCRNFLLLPLAAMLGLGAVFYLMPSLDIRAAAWFFNGERFDGRRGLWGLLYEAVPYAVKGAIVGLLALIIAVEMFKKPLWRLDKRAGLYLLLALALGPGLMVNTLFKDQWGRARPAQIEQFGGDKQFTPAWVMSDQCEKNCAFVSGHASVGFYVMAFAFVLRRRRVWLLSGIALGVLVGIARMAQGGHFLSDVLFCGFIVYWAALIAYGLVYRRWPARA